MASLVGGADTSLRAELASGDLLRVALLRYIPHVEAIASVCVDELVAVCTGLEWTLAAE